MSETFFCIKQGDHLSLRSLPDKSSGDALVDSPCSFLSTPPKVSMSINPTYIDVLFLKEKLKNLKLIIDCQESTVALWEAEMPKYDLLPKVKEQLARNKKLLEEITGAEPCR